MTEIFTTGKKERVCSAFLNISSATVGMFETRVLLHYLFPMQAALLIL